MTTADDLLPPFDDDVVESVATDHDVPTDRLASLITDHQRGVRDLPGVENLVYEWRRQFDGVVLSQTESAYYVAAPAWVWDEFAEALGASEKEAEALAAVHARQVRARTDVADPDRQFALVVLDRSN